jgi:hypothetical protein
MNFNMDEKIDTKKGRFGIYINGITSEKIDVAQIGSADDTPEHIKEILADNRITGFYYEEYDRDGNLYTRSVIIGDEMTISDYIEGMEMSEFPYDHKKYRDILKNNPDAKIILPIGEGGRVDLEHGEPKFIEPRDIMVYSEDELYEVHELRKDKQYATEVPLKLKNKIKDIDSAVEVLEDERKRGLSVYYNFFGIRLYSCDITLDGAYLDVFRKTKAEVEKDLEDEKNAIYQKKQKEVNDKKDGWIKRGEKMIYPEKFEKWHEFLDDEISDEISPGYRVEEMLEMMERLAQGESFETLYQTIEKAKTPNYKYLGWPLCNLAVNGPEFYEYILMKEADKHSGRDNSWYLNHIEYMKAENQRLAQLHPDLFVTQVKVEDQVVEEQAEMQEPDTHITEAYTGQKASQSEEQSTNQTLEIENNSTSESREKAELALIANVERKSKLISMIEFAQNKLKALRDKIAHKNNDDKTK